MKIRNGLVGLALILAAAGGEAQESAWEAYVREHPGAVDDQGIGSLERRILDAVTPEQAEAFFAGADPEGIVVGDSMTLADVIARAVMGGPGLVYEPLDQCRLFATFPSILGNMAADEIREFVARGGGTAHTDQGGQSDCLVPAEAVAVVLHVRLLGPLTGDPGRLKMWPASLPEPPMWVLDYEPTPEMFRFNKLVVQELCPVGACMGGEFKIKSGRKAAQLRGDVVGFFRPVEVADLPGGSGSGLDADTLDGLDSTAFAPTSHTHDGGDITSGVVGDSFIDSSIARDAEILPTVLAGDGPGSTLDADLLDGRDSLDLMLQVGNCLTVSPSCPAGAAEALAARCWQTVSAALAQIGVGLTGASPINRYLIRVGPGIYDEQVTMQQYVDIEGSGEKLTTITNATSPTLGGATDAELRHLTIENTGGGTAIQNSGVSPMINRVTARATGAVTAIAVKNGMGAAPMLTHLTTVSDGDGVENNGASATVRNSVLSGAVNGIENVTATASLVNAQITGGAADGGTGTSFTCLGAYDATFTELDANCQ